MSLWPFRTKAPPDDGVARNIGGGQYECTVWMTIAYRVRKVVGKRITYQVRTLMWTTRREAEDCAKRWRRESDLAPEFDEIEVRNLGTLTVTLEGAAS